MGWTSPAGPCGTCANDPVAQRCWSWSQLQQFELCQEKFRAVNVDKTHVEPKSDAMLRGQRVHEQFERALKHGSGLEPAYHHLFPFVQQLRQLGAKPEVKLALNANLQRVGYFDRSVWLRCVVDAHVIQNGTIAAVDWKTGRHKPDAFDQLRLIGSALLLSNPETIRKVDSRFIWVDDDAEPDCAIIDLRSALRCMVEMRARVARMVEAERTRSFLKITSWACRFCPVTECPNNRCRVTATAG